MTKGRIRLATLRDVKALAELRWEFRAAEGRATEERAAFLKRCAGWMRKRLADEQTWRCWVATERAGPLGNLWLQIIPKLPNPVAEAELHGYITSFYVRPGARGRRIGSRLLEKALAYCRALQVHAVILWPTAQSRGLYERRGFTNPDDLLELIVTHPHL